MRFFRLLASATLGSSICTAGWAQAPSTPGGPPLDSMQNSGGQRSTDGMLTADHMGAPSTLLGPDLRARFDATTRYDEERTQDPIHLLTNTHERFGSFRGRLYLDSRVAGSLDAGIMVQTAGLDSPTVPFIRLGRQDRAAAFSLGRAFFKWKPLKNVPEVNLTFGKMANPLWRGDLVGKGNSELVWDEDVNPEGVSLLSPLPFLTTKVFGKNLTIQNQFNYFIFGNPTEDRFVGITRDYNCIEDQVLVSHDRARLGIAHLAYSGLNSGLRVASFIPGDSADLLRPSTDPFLFRPPLQHTNNAVGYGGYTDQPPAGESARGSLGFVSDYFDIWNVNAQYNIPGLIKDKQAYIFGDMTHNYRVTRDQNGYSVALGVRSNVLDKVGTFNSWFIWRNVAADAVLSAFSDSDLGAGSNYAGYELGGAVRIQPNTGLQLRFFHFATAPYGFKARFVRERLFVDLSRSF